MRIRNQHTPTLCGVMTEQFARHGALLSLPTRSYDTYPCSLECALHSGLYECRAL